MEKLLPELRDLISPRLKGKMQERQKNWTLVIEQLTEISSTIRMDGFVVLCSYPALMVCVWLDLRCCVQSGSESDAVPIWGHSAELWGRTSPSGGFHTHGHGPDHHLQGACDQQSQRYSWICKHRYTFLPNESSLMYLSMYSFFFFSSLQPTFLLHAEVFFFSLLFFFF